MGLSESTTAQLSKNCVTICDGFNKHFLDTVHCDLDAQCCKCSVKSDHYEPGSEPEVKEGGDDEGPPHK
jgi:hypothetical protein